MDASGSLKDKRQSALDEYRENLRREVDETSQAGDNDRRMELADALGFSVATVAQHLEVLRQLRDVETREPLWTDAQKLLDASNKVSRVALELNKEYSALYAEWMRKLKDAAIEETEALTRWHQADAHGQARLSIMNKYPELFASAEATAAAESDGD